MALPSSCDTFVVLPPLSPNGIIFGKNSDRPTGEVQELIFVPSNEHSDNSLTQCTYIKVPQVNRTHAVILSKPIWMWGCEMGANEHGLVIGNEAVWTKVADESQKALLGMDLVRLALERCESAESALNTITTLLEKFGQGGPCSETDDSFTYHNSYLIADRSEAWHLETAGRVWVAKKVIDGTFLHISNQLTIEESFDLSSNGLLAFAQEKGLWDGGKPFNWRHAFSSSSSVKDSRLQAGHVLLDQLTASKSFNVSDMFSVLRDKKSGICRSVEENSFPTAASQVSLLHIDRSKPACHWFTATPDPSVSVFKPFIFTKSPRVSQLTRSLHDADSSKEHTLYKLHQMARKSGLLPNVTALLRDMEAKCLREIEEFLANVQPNQSLEELDDLLKDIVEAEIKFYK